MTHVMLGECDNRRIVEILRERGWGRMWVHRRIKLLPGERWGFDNGAFGHWKRGEEFDADAYLRRLDRALGLGVDPELAVVPDLPARGLDSLAFSLDWLDRLPAWPWYLAVQDGMTADDVRPHLGRFAGLFLGGSTRFKTTAPEWCKFAHVAGLRFHYARCSTRRRLWYAQAIGADSLDTTQPLWTKALMADWLEAWDRPQLGLC